MAITHPLGTCRRQPAGAFVREKGPCGTGMQCATFRAASVSTLLRCWFGDLMSTGYFLVYCWMQREPVSDSILSLGHYLVGKLSSKWKSCSGITATCTQTKAEIKNTFVALGQVAFSCTVKSALQCVGPGVGAGLGAIIPLILLSRFGLVSLPCA